MAIEDAIYLLLAQKQDIYFSRHLMKLDYGQYLYQLLREQDYSHVFFFEEATGQEVDLFCETEADKNEYRRAIEGILTYLPIVSDTSLGRTRYKIRMKDKDARQNIIKLIRSRENDRYAFVLQSNLFGRLYRTIDEQNSFVQGINNYRYSKGSIFVLTAEAKAGNLAKDLPEKIRPGKEIYWNTFEERQLQRMLERVYLSLQARGRENFKAQYRMLCDEFAQGREGKSIYSHVTDKNELYRLLLRRSEFDRITRLAMKHYMND